MSEEKKNHKVQCSLSDIVFGQSLGEGKYLLIMKPRRRHNQSFHMYTYDTYRSLWECESRLVKAKQGPKVCSKDNEKGRDH